VKKIVGGGKANRKGTPQGGVISPLLANCYLHILDRIWQRRHLKGKLQAHLVRYADDFVVMCRKDVEEPLKVVRDVLERLGLSLNETKTHIVDATQSGFNFLGFMIQMSQGVKTGKRYPSVRPADRSLMKIRARLKELTGRNLTPIPLEDIVGNVNRSLRDWVNYFHYRNSSLVMSKVKTHAEERLRTHLMKRHKIKDRGTGLRRFPSRDLYDRYGLYKVPTVAGWRTAHALA
jgi:RNA-directed DNA polymerase